MKFDEILANITMLAETQGFYRQLLKRIKDKESDLKLYNAIKTLLEGEHFDSIFDMCAYFESKLNTM